MDWNTEWARKCRASSRGWSSNRLRRTFPAWLAVGSLDKAFVRGRIEVREARVVRTRLAKAASDHLPLVIDFHLW